jgi:uncharacterized membrane protein YkoI
MTMNLNKKVIIVAILAVGAVYAILIAPSIAQATVQKHHEMTWSGGGMPRINGSVSIANETSYLITDNAKVSFVSAAETAQKVVDDGKVHGGHLAVVQGYLVYKFFVANAANQTGYLTIIDAGNSEVLYTSEGLPLGSYGHAMYGHWNGHGYDEGNGPWKGHGWGMWR